MIDPKSKNIRYPILSMDFNQQSLDPTPLLWRIVPLSTEVGLYIWNFYYKNKDCRWVGTQYSWSHDRGDM